MYWSNLDMRGFVIVKYVAIASVLGTLLIHKLLQSRFLEGRKFFPQSAKLVSIQPVSFAKKETENKNADRPTKEILDVSKEE